MDNYDPLRGFRKPKVRNPELRKVEQIMSRPLHWIWDNHLLRGALELISGLPNIGKSQAQISLVASTTTRKPWPDGTDSGDPLNVIMLTAEDTLDQTVKPRLLAAGADTGRVYVLKCIKCDGEDRQFFLGEDLDLLEKSIKDIGDVALITIDPITAFMGGRMDSHKATEVRSQLGPLKDFAEKMNVAVSAITHPAKNAGPRAMDHFIGSQAFIAAARIGHVCVPEMIDGEKTGRILFTSVKYSASEQPPTLAYSIEGITVTDPINPYCELKTSHVVWENGAVDMTADEAVRAASGKDKHGGRQSEVQAFLKDMLGLGMPIPVSQILEEGLKRGFSKRQLDFAKDRLGIVSSQPGGLKSPWFWTRLEL
jgi:hypothetical protein